MISSNIMINLQSEILFKECEDKLGVDRKTMRESYRKLKAGGTYDAGMQQKIGCMIRCLLEKREIWKDGGLDAVAAKVKASEIIVLGDVTNREKAIDECASKRGADECDTGFQLLQCIRSKAQ